MHSNSFQEKLEGGHICLLPLHRTWGIDFYGKCLRAVWKLFFFFFFNLMLSCVSHERWVLLVIRTRWFEGLVSWVTVAEFRVLDVWTNSFREKAGNLVLLPELGENAGKVPTSSFGLQNDFSQYLVVGWSEARPSGSSCPKYATASRKTTGDGHFAFSLCAKIDSIAGRDACTPI